MTSIGVLQIAVFFGIVVLLTKPLGLFMAKLFQGERTFLHPILRPVESLIYKVCGIREEAEQRWTQYAAGLLWFSVCAFLFVYVFQRLQGILPFNPQVVLARGSNEGFCHVLKPESIVLLGARKHWWRTREEKLARRLARDGHKVVLLHFE